MGMVNAKKKALLIAAVLLLAGGGFFWFLGGREKGGEKMPTPVFAAAPPAYDSAKDTDSDGLKDWEEPIYKTNPENPDTDGDGTNDGEEIARGRDPLKAGPDDQLAKPERTATPEEPNENNFTESLGRQFYEDYLRLKLADPNAQIDTKQAAERTVTNFFETYNPESIEFPRVAPTDIRVANDNSKEAVTRYLAAVSGIGQKYIADNQDPRLLFASIIQRDNYRSQLSRFDPMITNYEIAYEKLRETRVPSSWKDHHERFLNLVLRVKTILEIFRDADRDIIKTLVVAPQYEAAISENETLRQEAVGRLTNMGINFK